LKGKQKRFFIQYVQPTNKERKDGVTLPGEKLNSLKRKMKNKKSVGDVKGGLNVPARCLILFQRLWGDFHFGLKEDIFLNCSNLCILDVM